MFINREKDIQYLNAHFESEPNCLLFVYGPKSSGKSTLLEKVARQLDESRYAVNFLDLRQVIIFDFKSFLNIFFPKSLRDKAKDILNGFTINAGFFSVRMDEESILEENAFKIIVDKLTSAKKRGIQPIIILDEIQLLRHIYINGERHLIDELFNLFIALTKVRHIAHIVICTSDSYFIEEIYNSAKLAKTSEFFLLDHFEKEIVFNWLEKERFSEEQIHTVWDGVGGCPWEISRIIEKKKQGVESIQHICSRLIEDEFGKVDNFTLSFSPQKKKVFLEVIARIVEDGFCSIREVDDTVVLLELLREMIAHDFWFYVANKRKITANSKSIYWAFEKMLGG